MVSIGGKGVSSLSRTVLNSETRQYASTVRLVLLAVTVSLPVAFLKGLEIMASRVLDPRLGPLFVR